MCIMSAPFAELREKLYNPKFCGIQICDGVLQHFHSITKLSVKILTISYVYAPGKKEYCVV